MSRHLNTEKPQISPYVLISGNPERTKWAAKNLLKNAKLVNFNRLSYVYTGYYKNVRVSLATSGMGVPSLAIYTTELINDYGVKKIIRTGTTGALCKKYDLFDLVLATSAAFRADFTKNAWRKSQVNYPSANLNKNIIQTAQMLNLPLKEASVFSTDDFYHEETDIWKHCEYGKQQLVDMESAGLFALGKFLNCETACILTVSDDLTGHSKQKESTFEERIRGTKKMFELALNVFVEDFKKK